MNMATASSLILRGESPGEICEERVFILRT